MICQMWFRLTGHRHTHQNRSDSLRASALAGFDLFGCWVLHLLQIYPPSSHPVQLHEAEDDVTELPPASVFARQKFL